MNYRPVSVFLPEHAHRALKLFSVSQSTTMGLLILKAIDRSYPALKVLDQMEPPQSNNWFPDMKVPE